MELPQRESFEHERNAFEIVTTVGENRFKVFVTLDGTQVSPIYSVDINTNIDYFIPYKRSLIDHLVSMAKSDIKKGMYYKA